MTGLEGIGKAVSWGRGRFRKETFPATVAGLLSLVLGLEAIVVILMSFTTDRQIGMGVLLTRDTIEIPVKNRDGKSIRVEVRERTVPSGLLMGALCAGASLGGLGVYLAQRSENDRGSVVAKIGLATCVVGVLMAWSMIMATALLDSG